MSKHARPRRDRFRILDQAVDQCPPGFSDRSSCLEFLALGPGGLLSELLNETPSAPTGEAREGKRPSPDPTR